MRDLDIAILGGGPIGLSAGIVLHEIGYGVDVFERRPADTPLDDRRILALSEGSRLILSRLGVWQHLASATPITRIHVSDERNRSRVALSAAETGVPAMGYVTTFHALHAALSARIGADAALRVRHGQHARVAGSDSEGARIAWSGAEAGESNALLAIHAEGGAPHVTQDARTRDYGQWAIVAEVWAAQPAQQQAFEHFTEQGPVALLPIEDHYALVWTVPSGAQEDLLHADEDDFCQRLTGVVGGLAGPITRVARRGAFALGMRMTHSITGPRTVFMGNAAQQLHPVAAQGFNLGLRDVWTLRELLWRRPADPGAAALLAQYARQRQTDRQSSLWITDGMISIFGSKHPLLRAGRGLALHALGALGPLRNAFARRMMFGALH